MSSGRRLVGWTLCLTLVLSAVAVGPAAADHSTSDDWEGEFDPAQHSTNVHYQYSRLLTHTFRCDAPTGCFWSGDGSFHSQGDTRERVCEFLGMQVLWGDCSDVFPGWALVSSVERQHDPPTWSLRFCSQSGWGQNPLEEAWGTTNGPIDAEGHRSDVGQIGESMWFDPVPVATSIHEPPFCGDWTRAAIRVSIADATVDEGGNASLTITATGTGSGEVQFATADGSAVAGSDYERQSGVHHFSGPGTRTVTIRTIDDDTVEGSETFTVSLSSPSGVDIGTGTATVNILDDDDPDPDCPAGYTGTPPDCVPDVCPAGHTGTPPNCVPIVVLTGCANTDTRLSALTVRDGTSNVLAGFSPTTYTYGVEVSRYTSLINATTSDAAARVRVVGRGSTYTGSVTVGLDLSEGDSEQVEIRVTNNGESCAYAITVTRPVVPPEPVTSCPAWSGQELVNGVCVDACPLSNTLPVYDADGAVNGCRLLGDCPYDLYGFDPTTLSYYNYRAFDPLWMEAPPRVSPVAEAIPTTVVRPAVKCADYWNHDPLTTYTPVPHACIWAETNLKSSGDCLKISLSVEPVMPAVSGSPWSYRVGNCGYNRSADIAATWAQDDAVCSSADGLWGSAYYSFTYPTAPVVDTGDWNVTLSDLSAPSVTSPYVDVPLSVEINDWGDVSHLRVAIRAEPRYVSWGNGSVFAHWRPAPGQSSRSATTYVDIPRRSGPPPSDDIIEVSVAEAAVLPDLRGSNDRFVDILRSTLLANDACPVGVDCTDPLRWPMEVAQTEGACPHDPFVSGYPAERHTQQGAVGCDDLNDTGDPADPASVQYWPRLWAAGQDTFTYTTYGGTATVTVVFTDQAPAAEDIVVHDPGVEYIVATFDSPVDSWYVYRPTWCSGSWCDELRYRADYTRAGDGSASHHGGVVPLDVVRDSDPDDDTASIVITDGHNPHLTGQTGITSESGYSRWRTDATTPFVYIGYCYPSCPTPAERHVNFLRGGLYVPINPADGTSFARPHSSCVAHTETTTRRSITAYQYTHDTYPAAVTAWSAPTDTDPGCVPSIPDECGDAALLADWSMCYALWPHEANPAPLVVDYQTCDARRDAFEADQTAAEAVGRTEADYCSNGTITVLLGDSSAVSIEPTATATEGSPLEFTVTLDSPAAVDVELTFSVLPDTAGADPAEGSDYDVASDPGCRAVLLPVTIPAGQDRATVQVCTVQDDIHENDETLLVEIVSATGARFGTTTQAVGTIVNDDPLPQASIGDASVSEDASIPLNPPIDINGDGVLDTEYIYGETLQFAVTLTGESDRTITVAYNTETTPGTATSVTWCQSYPGSDAEDYRPRSGTLTFIPGDTSETFTVTLCPDDQYEGDETIIVTLSGPTNAALGTATATGTILDNESPPLTPLQQCELLHGPGWAPVLYPDDTPWTDSGGQIVCAMPH